MRQRSFVAVAIAAVGIVACRAGPPVEPAPATTAFANIEPRSGTETSGVATFTQTDDTVMFRITLRNVEPGLHAVHIHENGDCSAPDASSAGGHWNPTNQPHGRWGQGGYHLGDLGNVEVDANRAGSFQLTSDQWTFGDGGPRDIVGKSIVVHSAADDFVSQPAGNSGGRIGCGVITSGR